MHLRSRAALTIAGASMLTGLLAPIAAEAASYTSTGLRCTIVGTAKNDVLTGTAKRDVICGRGGRDRIQGRGGDDVIDAGGGKDVVIGGPGDDVLVGGGDDDMVKAGPGDDRVDGGSGDDQIEGQAGTDVLRGGAASDEIDGGGDDDVVLGDAGADVTSGGTGDDEVSGGTGDDELGGGPGADDIDGETGFNICDAPTEIADTQVRCVTDEAGPVVESLTVSPSVVDVSASAKRVHVRAHVTDDTGVTGGFVEGHMTLVAGDRRDGIWTTSFEVPRFGAPGPRGVSVSFQDRVGRIFLDYRENVYSVVSSTVDTEMPVLHSLRLSRASVDVRSHEQTITAAARFTDDLAGPGWTDLCAYRSYPSGEPRHRPVGGCVHMRRSSGNPTNGTWTATYDVPRGAVGGTWSFGVRVDDAAGNRPTDHWIGSRPFAEYAELGLQGYRLVPGDGGALEVIGKAQDLDPPVLTSVRLSPAIVDSSRGATRVTVDIAATDPQGITDVLMRAWGFPDSPDPGVPQEWLEVGRPEEFRLRQGTNTDGVWTSTFVVPGGTPAGTYRLVVGIGDSSHDERWGSPDEFDDAHDLTPAQAPSGLYFVVENS